MGSLSFETWNDARRYYAGLDPDFFQGPEPEYLFDADTFATSLRRADDDPFRFRSSAEAPVEQLHDVARGGALREGSESGQNRAVTSAIEPPGPARDGPSTNAARRSVSMSRVGCTHGCRPGEEMAGPGSRPG